MARSTTYDKSFLHRWQAEILDRPPLIAPGRQYVYPQAVEEVERGALQILLRPQPGAAPVMMTFALGFADEALPHGLWSCPNPGEMCAIAGGYAYIVQINEPATWTQILYRPVISVHAVAEYNLLIFSSFHRLMAWGRDGKAWETGRLSWEGLRIARILEGRLEGFGWDIATDSEVPFSVDLATGNHSGGAGPR